MHVQWNKSFALILAVALMLCPFAALGQEAGETPGGTRCWVEKAGIEGDPGDPTQDAAAKENYELYSTVDGKAPEYLHTAGLNRRFAKQISSETAADGSADVYYARGEFTYVFDIVNPAGEMEISGVTYKGGDEEQYTVTGKYGQEIVVPGLTNGLIPQNKDPEKPEAYCAGWSLDERTEDKSLLTYAPTVIEAMLPTDDMPYEELTFTLKAVWEEAGIKSVMVCWYEQLPEEEGIADLNRMNYNGKVYVNYPATNYEVNLPEGSVPVGSSAPGLKYVTRIDPEAGKEYPENATWQFVYDREGYTVSFDTNGAESIGSQSGIKYQHNLGEYDPGWNEGTTREQGGQTYRFAGWYVDGTFVGYSLGGLYMPTYDVQLEARWESQ